MNKRGRVQRRELLGLGLTALAPAALLAAAGGRTPAFAGGSAPATRGPADATAETTALIVSATNAPLRVPGSDGMEHLEYDLILSNVFSVPVTLTTIEVLAPDDSVLLRLEGDALAAVTQPVFFTGGPPVRDVPVAGTVAAVIDLVVAPDQVPARITHRISYAVPDDAPARTIIADLEIADPELTADPRPPFVLAPPLRGRGWFNLNSTGSASAPHRFVRLAVDGSRYIKPETFAIDWVQLRDDRIAEGDGSRNEQYFCFGAEVVAAAAGTVVATRDGMPDETPNHPPVAVRAPGDYAGNHVVIEIAPGVFAVYVHLQPGSIRVRVGERVETGQLLGLLGSSGNSTAPHLHFGLQDAPGVLTSNSLPFVFDRYTLAGTIDPDALAAALSAPDAAERSPVLPVEQTAQVQTDTFPLIFTVIDFP